jgi:hypothetical protein
MPNTASPLATELLSGHALMMQCGTSALRILDHAGSADMTQFDLRAGDEAIRMAGLSARLMRYHTTGVQLLHRLPPAARASSPMPSSLRRTPGPNPHPPYASCMPSPAPAAAGSRTAIPPAIT